MREVKSKHIVNLAEHGERDESVGSTADKMAKEQSERSVVAALAPVCAEKFPALPDAEAKTIALS